MNNRHGVVKVFRRRRVREIFHACGEAIFPAEEKILKRHHGSVLAQ